MTKEIPLRFVTYERDSSGNLNVNSHAAKLAAMHEEFADEVLGTVDGVRERFHKELQPDGKILSVIVAFDGTTPVGYGVLRRSVEDTDGTKGVFSDAYVAPPYRRKGIFFGAVTNSIKISAQNLHLKQVEATPIGVGYAYHSASLERRGFRKVPGMGKTMRLAL